MPSADSSEGLRSMLLDTDPAALDLSPTADLPRVWAALMEMGFKGATVTLVAVADGSTSQAVITELRLIDESSGGRPH